MYVETIAKCKKKITKVSPTANEFLLHYEVFFMCAAEDHTHKNCESDVKKC